MPHGIARQTVQQLLDFIVVEVFELEAGPCNALIEADRLAVDEVITDLEQLFDMLATSFQSRFHVVRFREI